MNDKEFETVEVTADDLDGFLKDPNSLTPDNVAVGKQLLSRMQSMDKGEPEEPDVELLPVEERIWKELKRIADALEKSNRDNFRNVAKGKR